MRLAFWNSGVPREVEPTRVQFPNGDMAYDASPDPMRDLYEFSATKETPCHPWQKETLTYTLVNNIIIETRFCSWPPIAELKAKKKSQVTAQRQVIASGAILVDGRKIKCTDGNIAELEILINQASRGKVTFPVKATTSSGIAFQFTNLSEAQTLLDAAHNHRQITRNIDYDHLIAIDLLIDPLAVVNYDHLFGWPTIVGN